MFSSIRGRLWLTYAGLILVVLLIVTAVVAVFLVRNPYTYRQTTARVVAAQNLLRTARAEGRTDLIAAALDVRVIVYAPDGSVISDTSEGESALRMAFAGAPVRAVQLARDGGGSPWLYSRARLADGSSVVVAAPRPRLLPALDALGDELWRPMIQGTAFALVLALITAYLLSGWIGLPLQRLVHAAQGVGAASRTSRSVAITPRHVPEGGPREARELTRAFNAMIDRVAASDKAQRDFVANVSHELKTPLTAIQGFAQAIRDGTAESRQETVQAAEIIEAEAGRLHRMAVDLLDLAGIDAGTTPVRLEVVDLSEVIGAVKARMEDAANAAGIALELEAIKPAPPVRGDADRIIQILTNIVDNALKFTPRGGRIGVKTEHAGEEVRISVRDTGPGIRPEDMAHVFDRFYQADAARGGGTRHGAGLGLSIAREFAEAQGGRITVRSVLGQGAEFVVHLPLEDGSR